MENENNKPQDNKDEQSSGNPAEKQDVNNTVNNNTQNVNNDLNNNQERVFKPYSDQVNGSGNYNSYNNTNGYSNPVNDYYASQNYLNQNNNNSNNQVPYYYENLNNSQKVKKEKKTVHFAAVIAIALICAILGGALTLGGYALLDRNGMFGINTNQQAQPPLNENHITIENTSDDAVIPIYQKVSPSVVGIRVTSTAQSGFFGSQTGVSEGSGIIYDTSGYIVTNYHVISNGVAGTTMAAGSKIDVFLSTVEQGTSYPAKLIGFDSETDLAVIQITGVSNLVPIEFADSESVQVGQSVVAIGSPGGLDFMNSISQGIVSGLNRNLATDSGTSFNLIQTDAAINPGNSGGALIDKTGKLIGINVIKIASEEYEGMGFAIPSNTVKSIADELISKGTVIRATIGIYISNDYTKDFADRYGLPYGVEVSQIIVGGAAESTDLQVNDVIVKFNGNDVNDYDALKEQLSQYKPGDQVTLTVYRPSTKENIDIQLVLGEG